MPRLFPLLKALGAESQPPGRLLVCSLNWPTKEWVRIIATFSAGKIGDGSHWGTQNQRLKYRELRG